MSNNKNNKKEYDRNKKEILKVTWYIYAVIIVLVVGLFWFA